MIEVHNLWKTFRLYRSPQDRLKEIVMRRIYSREFTALKGVSFTLNEGEILGVIGENGAGKSTLLKILTGIYLPTKGQVKVDGHITGILDLGTGFNQELTGLKNIYMNGLLIGMTKNDIDRKLEQIISFTELGEFIEEPIKTYSSGMLMRLAFSIAIHAEPKAFVVDEALSVGDAYFQQKCMNRIRAFRESGGSIIFVSHDLNAVKVLCDRAMLLNHGEVLEEGDPDQVINAYNFTLAKKSKGEEIVFEKKDKATSYGNFKVEMSQVELRNEQGIDSRVFVSGEKVTIGIQLKASADVDRVVVGILLRDRFGQDIFGTNTFHLNRSVAMHAGDIYLYEYSMPLNIGPGKYTLTIAAHRDADHISESYHWHDSVLNFEVVGAKDYFFSGLVKLDVKLNVTNVSTDNTNGPDQGAEHGRQD
jgi:lipopolysaccharide transport system ATP-binding protein